MNAIKDESQRIEVISHISSSLWMLETELYEDLDLESFLDLDNFDTRMFPYVPALFPLRDFVFTFSHTNLPLDIMDRDTLPSLVFEPRRRISRDLELPVPGYCPCSAYALMKTLVPPHRATISRSLTDWDTPLLVVSEEELHSSFFNFLDEWSTELVAEAWDLGKSMNKPTEEQPPNSSFSLNEIPPENLFIVLLEVLQHATSDLQRDHRLARAILLVMIEYKLLNDDENLRSLLSILSSEYQNCNSRCHEDFITNHGRPPDHGDYEHYDHYPQHYCDDYQNFRSSIRHVLAYGMNFLSDSAVHVIIGFVNKDIEPIASSNIGGPIPSDSEWENVDDIHFIVDLIGALHSHGCLAKHNIVHYFRHLYSSQLSRETHINVDMERIRKSYENCLKCLLYIGETFLLRLLPSDGVCEAGGYLVKALVTLLNSEYFPFTAYSSNEYLGSISTEGRKFPSVISVTRYSDMITLASKVPERRLKETQQLLLCTDLDVLTQDSTVKTIFLSPVSKEISTVVRGLFLRQLVDLNVSCCGYGDFLVWCQQPISCHDKLLFSYECNYPMSDEEIELGRWGVGETVSFIIHDING
jgi:hypothetical protein